MAERPDHAEAMAEWPLGAPVLPDWMRRSLDDFHRFERELAALRRLYDVARRRYGRDVALDMALDAVEEAQNG